MIQVRIFLIHKTSVILFDSKVAIIIIIVRCHNIIMHSILYIIILYCVYIYIYIYIYIYNIYIYI